MAFWDSLGTALSFINPITDIAGTLFNTFSSNKPGKEKDLRPPFRGRVVTPAYSLGGGQLARLNTGVLDQERSLQTTLGGLRQQVAPGFGQLTTALGQQFAAQRGQAVGNLRASLAQRGVLGSSFAENQIQQAESEFSMQEATAKAQAFQQEFAATLDTINMEAALVKQQLSRELSELGLAADFLSGVDQIVDSNAKDLQKIAQRKAYEALYQELTGQHAPPMPEDDGNGGDEDEGGDED